MKKILFAFSMLIAFAGSAQTDATRQGNFNVKKNIALEGYDPVSYFAQNQPKAMKKFVHAQGHHHLFATQTNLNKFKTSPEKYEPAYGGWCAYAMGETGEKVKIDPETYKIIDGKLYMFYNFGATTLEDWNENENHWKQNRPELEKSFSHNRERLLAFIGFKIFATPYYCMTQLHAACFRFWIS